jgi:uroporphyrinogen decarboxylase
MQMVKEIVKRCLTFDYPQRMPRHLWYLPWAEHHYPQMMDLLRKRYPSDFANPDYLSNPSPRVQGDPYKTGIYIDEWGCHFKNIQEGIIGEVDRPLIKDPETFAATV